MVLICCRVEFSLSEGGAVALHINEIPQLLFPADPSCSYRPFLPRPPHTLRVCNGGHAQGLPSLRSLRRALVVLAVRLVQVWAQFIVGRVGKGRGRAGPLSGPEPSAAVGPWSVRDQVHQDVLEVVLVQRHALQQVVEELGRHCGVYARTVGHKHVDLVHALDVASCEPLAGFPAECIGLWGRRVELNDITVLLHPGSACNKLIKKKKHKLVSITSLLWYKGITKCPDEQNITAVPPPDDAAHCRSAGWK